MSANNDKVNKDTNVLYGEYSEDNNIFKYSVVLICFHLLYLILPLTIILLPVYNIIFNKNNVIKAMSVLLLAVYFSSFDGCHKKGGCPRPFLVNNPLIKWIFEWLPMRLYRTVPLDPSKQYVFACHPHGAFAFNRGLVGFCTDVFWEKAFPGIKFRVLTATAAFYVPWIREMWLWSYCVDASKQTALYVMNKLNCSIFVYPGGEREQMETVRGKHILYLKNRKGFIKLAIQQGAMVVPVYSFGECDLYHHYSIGIGFRKALVKNFGIAVPIVTGQFGLLPYRTPVTMVFGSPINVGKNPEPSEEELNNAHDKYMKELILLFNNNKEKFGYKNATLEII